MIRLTIAVMMFSLILFPALTHAVEVPAATDAAAAADPGAAQGTPDSARPTTVIKQAPDQASLTLGDLTAELLSRFMAQLFSGNKAQLLSGNETEAFSGNKAKLLSGNKAEFISGNRINVLSNIQIDIHVSGLPNPAQMMGGQMQLRMQQRGPGGPTREEPGQPQHPESGPQTP